MRRDCWEFSAAGVRRGHGEEKKNQTDNEILKLRVFGVEVLELRKYYNIQIEYKNKYDTFQVQHLIAAVQIAIKGVSMRARQISFFLFFFPRQFARGLWCGNLLLWQVSAAKPQSDASKCKTELYLCKCIALQGKLSEHCRRLNRRVSEYTFYGAPPRQVTLCNLYTTIKNVTPSFRSRLLGT